MSIFQPQNPGIGGLDELTNAEEAFLTSLAGISYTTGDMLYFDGANLTNLGIGSSGQVLKVTGGVPAWGAAAAADLNLAADEYIIFNGNSLGYATTHGATIFTGSELDFTGGVTMYGNTASDGSGVWSPWMEWNTGGEFIITADGGTNDIIKLIGTDGVGIKSTNAGGYALLKTTAFASQVHSIEFQNKPGTLALTSDIATADTDTFEKVNKNLKAYDYAITMNGDYIDYITYDLGGALSIVKTFGYTGSNLTTVVLSGDLTLADKTKTLTYDGNDVLTNITYST